MNATLSDALKRLRLSGLAGTLEVRLQEAKSNRLDHTEFLELILQDELAVRHERQIARRGHDGILLLRVKSDSHNIILANRVPTSTPVHEQNHLKLRVVLACIVRASYSSNAAKQGDITAQVRFKGGSHQTLTIPRPLKAWEIRQTDPAVISEIDGLLNNHTVSQVAEKLNERGFRSGEGCEFTNRIVARLCRNYQLKSRYDRLREAGKLTLAEIAEQLQVTTSTIKVWRRHGLLCGHPYNDKNECLYDPPDQAAPVKSQGQKLSERRRFPEVLPNRTNEVQHAT